MRFYWLAISEKAGLGCCTAMRWGVIAMFTILLVLGSPMAGAAGKAKALLLTCMDYRLTNEVERYMVGRGLRDRYDHIIIAGASLGAITDQYPAWNRMFWDHVDLSIKLHHVPKIIIMDHRDCGAFKLVLGEDFAKDPVKETGVHVKELKALERQIREKYPQLEVELLLMDLQGKVEKIK